MKTKLYAILLLLAASSIGYGQEIKSLLGGGAVHTSGGYGALTNKFTRIGGHYANMGGIYGGWYVNHKFMIGVSGAAVTNDIPVPAQYSTVPFEKLSYEYGQCGMITEYVVGSNRAFHVGFQLFSGAGFTTQYNRYSKDDYHSFNSDKGRDTNWFFVAEPGVNIEMNIFKWMRLCPGISYRKAYGSEGLGLKDKDIDGATYNVSLKFGKF
ncbi:MAG TPA: hypothetical protein VL443_15160 [Cyclobacteriaceae bacterium]|jgi:hypothetical protein|nr:hypothetical protein [Cyclobacteriaceae bacterium]